jgi:hypothetical protein
LARSRVRLVDHRRVGIGGQLADGARDAVAHVVGRRLQIGADVELHADLAALLA